MHIMKQILAFFSVITGVAVLFFACTIPVYFTSVDKHVVIASGNATKSLEDVASLCLDNSQISSALILAKCMNYPDITNATAEKLLQTYPNWRITGGECPFYETFCSSITLPKKDFIPVFNALASAENRQKMFAFLFESKNAAVQKILSIRDLNTVMLPPAYSSAGAPFEASLLTTALLVQSSNVNEKFALELSSMLLDISNSATQARFEKCMIGVLVLSKTFDYSSLSMLFKSFKTPEEVYDFAKIYTSQKDEFFKYCMYSAVLLTGDAQLCINYLKDSSMREWGNLSFALICGEGAVNFLLKNNKPIYENSSTEQFIDSFSAPIKNIFAPYCVNSQSGMMVLKILLVLVGGAFIASGFLQLIDFRKKGAFYAVRCLLFSVVCSVLFFAAIEPEAFEVKIQNSTATNFKVAFDRIKTNIVGEKDTMSLDTDTATLAAIVLFFVIQLIVYVVCLVRINVVKRTRASASLKLKLLDNEDNLFDLGLYIGLSGTVASLILLTFGIINASLMAGYTSTLFGILFTALVKIVHIRKFKRQLLIEASNEQNR